MELCIQPFEKEEIEASNSENLIPKFPAQRVNLTPISWCSLVISDPRFKLRSFMEILSAFFFCINNPS